MINDCIAKRRRSETPNLVLCNGGNIAGNNSENAPKYYTEPWITPEEGNVLAPWISIVFHAPAGSQVTGNALGDIAVSNRSSPSTSPQHVAVITGFEFGYEDGISLRLVIQDQQGGSFHRFMENCIKHFACLGKGSGASVEMKFSFGWVKSGCTTPLQPSSSPCYFAIIDSIETSYSEGKFTFEVTGKDKGHRMLEGGVDLIYGGEGQNAVSVRFAINELFTNGPPPNVKSVKFMKNEGGTTVPCEFKEGGFDGPKGKWLTSGQDKLRAVLRWLERCPTKDKRGWKPAYNFQEDGGEIIFWEERAPLCGAEDDGYWAANSIGTYIVNGSKYSPVIEFAPKIRWDFSRLQSVGGGLSNRKINDMQNEGSKNPGNPCDTLNRKNNPGAGQNIQTTPTETETDIGISQHESAHADAVAMRAMRLIPDPISADLTIIGDPTLVPPKDGLFQRNCSIILINPYFIMPKDQSCGDWLAEPVCNPILSNKAWQIRSITHRIEAGAFTTTLSLFLSVPGEDIDVGQPLGAWVGGWTPSRLC